MTLTVGSLFSGIGGLELGSAPSVSLRGVEANKAIGHHRNGYLFKLNMPDSMCLSINDDQVFWPVVVLIEIDMMDALSRNERASSFIRSYQSMLCDIASLVGVGMSVIEDVEVSVAEAGSLPSLSLARSAKDATPSPCGVQGTSLVALGGDARWNTHLLHGTPYDMLGGSVFLRYLLLAHPQFDIVTEELFLSERNAVCVFVTHTGIIPYACAKGVMPC